MDSDMGKVEIEFWEGMVSLHAPRVNVKKTYVKEWKSLFDQILENILDLNIDILLFVDESGNAKRILEYLGVPEVKNTNGKLYGAHIWLTR